MKKLALGVLLAGVAWAGTWTVTGRLEGKEGKKAADISGIACTTSRGFPRSGLIVDDETPFAQFVTVQDGELHAETGKVTLNEHGAEFDGEGVAYADGFYYVLGSHGHPRDKKHKLDADQVRQGIAACSRIVRVPVAGGQTESTTRLRDMVNANPKLATFCDQRLEKNGLTVEGIAVLRDRLYVGFRGPLIGGQAVVLSDTLAAFFGDKKPAPRVELLNLGAGRGVRDLAVWNDRILVLAGPSNAHPGMYSVFRWDEKLLDLPPWPGNPEALLPLETTPAGLRLLILLDAAKQGNPHEVLVPL